MVRVTHSHHAMKLDPLNPVESVLDGLKLTRTELARRMSLSQGTISEAVARRTGVSVAWLHRAANALGMRLEIRLRK